MKNKDRAEKAESALREAEKILDKTHTCLVREIDDHRRTQSTLADSEKERVRLKEGWKQSDRDSRTTFEQSCKNKDRAEKAESALAESRKKALAWGEHARESQKAARKIESERDQLAAVVEKAKKIIWKIQTESDKSNGDLDFINRESIKAFGFLSLPTNYKEKK